MLLRSTPVCFFSLLSSQGAKTCTARDMANSASIATFHKKMADLHNDVIMQVGHCVRTRYKYSWGRSIQQMGGNVVIGRSIHIITNMASVLKLSVIFIFMEVSLYSPLHLSVLVCCIYV